MTVRKATADLDNAIFDYYEAVRDGVPPYLTEGDDPEDDCLERYEARVLRAALALEHARRNTVGGNRGD